MKKTVFKGTINGENFDSVQKYNEEMVRIMNAGESIDAHSETYTVDEEDEPYGETVGEEDDIILYYPGFDDPGEYYLDTYVTGDSEKDAELYLQAKKYLDKSIKEIKENMIGIGLQELNTYKTCVAEILDCIEDNETDNVQAIENFNEKIANLEKEIAENKRLKNICVNSSQIISLFKEKYLELFEAVIKNTEKHTDSNPSKADVCDCECCHSTSANTCVDKCDCKNGVSMEDLENQLSSTINKLFKEIFK